MNLIKHIQRQIKFSSKTFGPGRRTKGLIEHIHKELKEIEAAPSDLEEWIDVMILAIDGAWRAGYTPSQIDNCITRKQIKNEGRDWPDWQSIGDDRAIEHLK